MEEEFEADIQDDLRCYTLRVRYGRFLCASRISHSILFSLLCLLQ